MRVMWKFPLAMTTKRQDIEMPAPVAIRHIHTPSHRWA